MRSPALSMPGRAGLVRASAQRRARVVPGRRRGPGGVRAGSASEAGEAGRAAALRAAFEKKLALSGSPEQIAG